jgi:hypothetical protein
MNGWTPERRKRQGAAIHRWRPWERSAGPKTAAGKGRVARNAYTGATRPLLRELARASCASRGMFADRELLDFM